MIGAGEPGLSGVALGHKPEHRLGFTIFGLDQRDLYVEQLNPGNAHEYRTEAGWVPMLIRREKFLSQGGRGNCRDLGSRHGPVLWRKDGKRCLRCVGSGASPGRQGYLASLAIDRAGTGVEFRRRGCWKVPSENIVYADRAGNDWEHSVGLAPIRSWTGLLPMPGVGNYNWAGFVPVSRLPQSFNPAEGFVVTANHKMIPDHYPYNVGFEWESPYRFERIRSVIEGAHRAQHKLTIAESEALQNDVVSLPARALQGLVQASAMHDNPELTEFLRWDGELVRASRELRCMKSG